MTKNTPPFLLPPTAFGRHTTDLELTPEIARQMLVRNTHPRQRGLSTNRAREWRGRILRGEHRHTHQGIAFGADGFLYDGQHRLTGLSMCPDHTRIVCSVTYNLPPESFMAMDQGKSRTAAQVLGDSSGLVACARALAVIDTGESAGLTAPVLEPYVELIRPHFDALVEAASRAKYRYWSGAMVRAAAIMWMLDPRGNRDYVLRSYRALNQQDYTAMDPVVLAAARAENRGDMPRAIGHEVFAKLTRIFDYQNRDSRAPFVKDPSAYADWVRSIMVEELGPRHRRLALVEC